jgi:hypothetical protein
MQEEVALRLARTVGYPLQEITAWKVSGLEIDTRNNRPDLTIPVLCLRFSLRTSGPLFPIWRGQAILVEPPFKQLWLVWQ